MQRVSIYAIALRGAPRTIRYVGSSVDPAHRLRCHERGIDSGQVRAFFRGLDDVPICYVIEWVEESLRMPAEAYWYVRLRGEHPLVNSAWPDAPRRAQGYTTSALFDIAATASFTSADGYRWHNVEDLLAKRQQSAERKAREARRPAWAKDVAMRITLEAPWLAE